MEKLGCLHTGQPGYDEASEIAPDTCREPGTVPLDGAPAGLSSRPSR